MRSAVVVARTRRDVVTLTGPETETYLQGQLSQDVTAMEVGDVAWSFVLQPQGRVDTWMRVDRSSPDTFRLDTEVGAGPGLLQRLERFRLRTRTEPTLTEGVEVLSIRGAEVLDGVPCGWPGVPGSDVFDPMPDRMPSDLPADAVEGDPTELEVVRIVAGVPAMGAEVTPDTIPAELGQWVIDASVSFTKGCFTGQELVARIDSRGGNVPRHLRGIVGGVDPALAVGSPIEVDGREVGTITSAAVDGDRTVALATVHRSVEPPAGATVAGVDVRVLTLPLPL